MEFVMIGAKVRYVISFTDGCGRTHYGVGNEKRELIKRAFSYTGTAGSLPVALYDVPLRLIEIISTCNYYKTVDDGIFCLGYTRTIKGDNSGYIKPLDELLTAQYYSASYSVHSGTMLLEPLDERDYKAEVARFVKAGK